MDTLANRMREPGKKVVKMLAAWRKRNNLSPRQIGAMMQADGFPIQWRTIESWDYGKVPSLYTANAVEAFIAAHPTVIDPPKFGRWKKPLPAEQVTEIHRLRKQGLTLGQIAQKFDISESSVSRICSGSRRAK
jgi:hypothetical protein